MTGMHSVITLARTSLVVRFPFFGYLAMSAPFIKRDDVELAVASQSSIYYNEERMLALPKVDRVYVVAHEVMHLALRHATRMAFRNQTKWNVAADMVVNHILDSNGLTRSTLSALTFNDLPGLTGKPNPPGVEDMPVEHIYAMLPDIDMPEGALSNDLKDDDDSDSADNARRSAMWKARMRSAAAEHRMSAGALPSWLLRGIDISVPKLDWRSILSQFIGTCISDLRTYRRPSRRHLWRGAVLPSSSRDGLYIAAVLDVSGSVSNAQLGDFVAEVLAIADAVDMDIRLIAHDSVVTLDTEYKSGMPIPDIKGGGGTCFEPVIEAIGKSGGNPDAVVWLTDGHGSYPSEPPYPVLWVLTERHREPPWGWKAEMK